MNLQKIAIITFLVLLLRLGSLYSQSIDVSPEGNPNSNLTAIQLIDQVLISGAGIDLDEASVMVQDSGDGTNNRSWGYFESGTSNFPFDDGIVLTTGSAIGAEGPNNSSENTSGNIATWPGDNDLQVILDNANGDQQETFNATVFQFDFIPEGNNLSFDFIFASEEYEDDYECELDFRDGFAFLIKGPGIDNNSGTDFGGTNLAAIPGSENVIVNTGSIHADFFLCGEEILGTNFFPDFYISNSGNNDTGVVEYDGYTDVLEASIDVIEGERYTIKITIADRGDFILDSAVFIRGFSVKSNVVIVDEEGSELDFTMCEGEDEILTANFVDDPFSGSETYEWQLDDVTIPNETTNAITVTEGGTYKVIVRDGGSEYEDTITVTLAQNPNAGESGNTEICTDSENIDLFTILTGTPDTGGVWSPTLASGTGVFDPNLDTAGTYTYTVTLGDCGSDEATVDIEISDVPNAGEPNPIQVCTNTEPFDLFTILGGNPDTGGSWTPLPASGNGIFDPSIDSAGEYTYTVTSENGCGTASATIDVEIVDTPEINVISITCMDNETYEVIYELTDTSLFDVSASIGTLDLANNRIFDIPQNEVVDILISSEVLTSCSYTETVNPPDCVCPEIELPTPDKICVDNNGEPILDADFPIIDTELDEGEYIFDWTLNGNKTGDNLSSITAEEPGIYTVIYTKISSGCTGTATTTVDVKTGPENLSLTLTNGIFDANNDIIATVTGEGTYEFALDDGEFQSENIFENVSLGYHTVTVSSTENCGTISESIFVMGFPNFFTPNNDGFNDVWNVISEVTPPPMNIYIFNRYGKLMTQLDETSIGWDGVYNGQEQPATDYWFVAELKDGSAKYSNHFTLKR